MPPAAGAAVAASTASAVMACGIILLWGVLPEARASFAVIALPLILMPLVVAAATWIATQRAVRTNLDRAVECVDRITAHDLATPTTLAATGETAGLALALERCRVALNERQRAGKIHAAVARVMGLAIGRLAEGDLAARISVELPPPYQSFRDDFNAAMERLESPSQETCQRLRQQAREITEAAAQLSRRAAKLGKRIEADIAAFETGESSAEEALRAACHTLGGAGIAARRNVEAAERFAAIGRLLEQEADRLAGEAVGGEAPPSGPAAPAADVTVLKFANGG